MLPEKILQSNLLDILFENRNKNYGAYALRKNYNKTMMIAIGCTLFTALFFSVMEMLRVNKQRDILTEVTLLRDDTLFKVAPVIHPPKAIAAAASNNHIKQIISTTPKIVDDATVTPPPTVDEVDKAVIGSINANGKDSVDIIQPPAGENSGKGTQAAVEPTAKTEDELPLHSAQVMPEFPGGVDALIKFIQKNVHQPDDLQDGEKIRVIASFVISKTGLPEKVQIQNSGRKDLDDEVLRAVRKMPLWKPGMQNGKNVAVYFNLPVTFEASPEP